MRKGFTLIETVIAIGIGLALLGFILANYRRGGDDSALSREVNLLMGRIRLAQEETASGKTLRYCSNPGTLTTTVYFSGGQCTSSADCDNPATSGNDNLPCSEPIVPPGGYGLTFSCGTTSASPYDTLTTYPTLSALAKTHYYAFADIAQFTGDHYPAVHTDPMTTPLADHQVVYHVKFSKYRGDTLMADYQLGRGVVIQDVYLREEDGTKRFSCLASDTAYTRSPWNYSAVPVPELGGDVTSGFPLQASIFFDVPDGRNIILSDNVYTSTPPPSATPGVDTLGKPWEEIGVMLKLTKRNVDCRYVKVTKNGTITQGVDTDCKF